ncbi:MAG: hypothetical protein AMJ53_16220 [Gammaproteobacteria bacterium SG8_11]|jgi:hypothetical protein|nr:MAG: hypothetical protein AMJ53_16220 [Gammaproteobacteria bacterium SG8_11]
MTTGRLERLFRELTSRRQITQAIDAVESGDRSSGWIGAGGMTASGGRVAGNTTYFIARIDKLYNLAGMLNAVYRLNCPGFRLPAFQWLLPMREPGVFDPVKR